jgi:hypothetical protein
VVLGPFRAGVAQRPGRFVERAPTAAALRGPKCLAAGCAVLESGIPGGAVSAAESGLVQPVRNRRHHRSNWLNPGQKAVQPVELDSLIHEQSNSPRGELARLRRARQVAITSTRCTALLP